MTVIKNHNFDWYVLGKKCRGSLKLIKSDNKYIIKQINHDCAKLNEVIDEVDSYQEALKIFEEEKI